MREITDAAKAQHAAHGEFWFDQDGTPLTGTHGSAPCRACLEQNKRRLELAAEIESLRAAQAHRLTDTAGRHAAMAVDLAMDLLARVSEERDEAARRYLEALTSLVERDERV